MKYCENCRVYINDEKMVYCGICRSQMIDVDPNSLVFTADDYICPNCGYMYRENIGNCTFCGAELVPLGEGDLVKAIPNKKPRSKNTKKKAVIGVSAAVAAVLLLIAGLLMSGVLKKPTPTTTDLTAATDATTGEPLTAETESTAEAESTTEAPADEGVSLQKVGTIGGFSQASEGGLVYRGEDKKYGVMSLDGKKDTGAIYEDADIIRRYFKIAAKRPADENDFDGINAKGLIDGSGKELIPAEYAAIERLNDRYWEVFTAREKTDSDDYLLYMSAGEVYQSHYAKDNDPRYNGEWTVFDVVTSKPVPGVSGTNDNYVTAYGDTVYIHTDEDERIYVNEKGERLPDSADVFSNGWYMLPQGNDYVIFDSLGKEAFRCAADGFIPLAMTRDNGYFIAKKRENSQTKYVVMDLTGKTISFEFNNVSSCLVWQNFLFVEGSLYDFSGNKILTDSVTYSDFYTCDNRDCGLLLRTLENDYALLDTKGNLVWSGKGTKDCYVNTTNITIENRTAAGAPFFNWKDRDFTIPNALSLGEGFVQTTQENSTRSLVDTVTGETLLSGYKNYAVGGNADDGLYVYAVMADGNVEIYKMN